jgi:hypothetical protein
MIASATSVQASSLQFICGGGAIRGLCARGAACQAQGIVTGRWQVFPMNPIVEFGKTLRAWIVCMAVSAFEQCGAFLCQQIRLVAIALWLTTPLAAQTELEFPVEAYDEPQSIPTPPVVFDFDEAFAQIRDPAIETVDELSRNPAAGSGRTLAPTDESFGRRVQNRWDKVQDPAITTVDQLTRDKGAQKDDKKKDEWYDKINIRGYTQFRINSLLWNDPDLANAYHPADRSVTPLNHFFIRRCRLIFSGNLSEHLFFYIQPDFAANVPGAQDGAINFTQLRDCYGDVNLTTDKVHRVRVGLSKVPFGWDNMQSSSNRLPLDRSDPINSAINGERGMGVFYY